MGEAASLMIHTVTRKLRTGMGAGGAPTFASATTIAVRLEKQVNEVKDGDGRVRVSQNHLISETEFFVSDRVWLPGADTGDDNKSEDVLAVKQAETTGGYNLYEAFL